MKQQFEPREWQLQALSLWRQSMRGIIAAVTGAGKTGVALLCIQEFLGSSPDGAVVIVVPTLALLDQWFVALTDELGVPRADIGVVASGRREGVDRPFVVSVVNSLRSRAPLSQHRPMMLVFDECHRAGSIRNANALAGQYVATLGLSATPERQYDDGFERFIRPALGDIIYEYGYDKALAQGVIVPFRLVNVRFSLDPSEQRQYEALSRRVAALMGNPEANEERIRFLLMQRSRISSNSAFRIPLAAKLAVQHRDQPSIVFHESVNQANAVYDLITARRVRATVYHTRMLPEKRRENLRLYKAGYYSCLVCCRALDEGLNVPRAAVGIIASSTASSRQRIQRLGRILRNATGKLEALVYTLYATDAEAKRLLRESATMQGLAEVRWLDARIEGHGQDYS